MSVELTQSIAARFRDLPVLLRGEATVIRQWLEHAKMSQWWMHVLVIITGTGLFGFAVGSWRAPLQALYCAVKLPSILLLTALGNGLLNAMLAPLLGLNLSLRQSLMAVLMSFSIAGAVLGSFSPIVGFLVINTPHPTPGVTGNLSPHSILLLFQTAVIAFGGVAANVRLFQLLELWSGRTSIARRVLLAWLSVNLALGSQLSWISRPFVGSPGLPVEFLRRDALSGNFFEPLIHALGVLFSP